MTPQQLIGLALRLASVWLLVIAYQIHGIVFEAFAYLQDTLHPLWQACTIVPVLASIALWMFPMLIAQKLLPRAGEANDAWRAVREATAACIVATGLWTGIHSAVGIVGGVFAIVVARHMGIDDMDSVEVVGTYFYAALAQTALAIALLSMPRHIATRIFRIQPTSTEASPA